MKKEEIVRQLNTKIQILTRNESHLGSIRVAREYYQKLITDVYDFANSNSNYSTVKFIESEIDKEGGV